ncbi:rhombosortase [Vibrio sp. 10N.286.49.C2]|uniref:rhombosortase n=1 Tax=unclassified Vibrio TaxID=2614977 RepID=UPI000C829508|nr:MULTISPECIES: rhombosortase [unclassified Vibrio]PMH33077.1 rhombosortase [Vibrio sp. 10N.286.49.C2]PMH48974.1 rhombosortase [Vibrio sp. 10N.286.49.B1]PMH78597.1 rhombosortase [Vibrio sp. 10N.286.48.B7]
MTFSFVIRLALISLFCLVLQIPEIQHWVIWDRGLISNGEWWRIVTGNFSHTNLAHLAMNLAGLVVICYLFTPTKKALYVLLALLSLTTGLGLLLTPLNAYLGLSGVLHGLFAYWALSECLGGRKSSIWLIVGVVAKVTWETLFGASQSTIDLIAANVATEAHAIGTVAGLLFSLGYWLYNRVPLQQNS